MFFQQCGLRGSSLVHTVAPAWLRCCFVQTNHEQATMCEQVKFCDANAVHCFYFRLDIGKPRIICNMLVKIIYVNARPTMSSLCLQSWVSAGLKQKKVLWGQVWWVRWPRQDNGVVFAQQIVNTNRFLRTVLCKRRLNLTWHFFCLVVAFIWSWGLVFDEITVYLGFFTSYNHFEKSWILADVKSGMSTSSAAFPIVIRRFCITISLTASKFSSVVDLFGHPKQE